MCRGEKSLRFSLGSGGVNSGAVSSADTLVTLTLGGSLVGGSATSTGQIFASGALGAVKILGDLVGGSITGVASLDRSGNIQGDRIASLFIGGSIRAGTDDDTFLGGGSATIASAIASITIKGQALGTLGGTDSFRFMAEKIDTLKVGATVFPLNKTGADNLLIGATGDLHVFDNA